MNERTRKLWTQCVIKHTKTPMNWQDVADEFAELIIQECANYLMHAFDDHHAAEQLIEYFGGEVK